MTDNEFTIIYGQEVDLQKLQQIVADQEEGMEMPEKEKMYADLIEAVKIPLNPHFPRFNEFALAVILIKMDYDKIEVDNYFLQQSIKLENENYQRLVNEWKRGPQSKERSLQQHNEDFNIMNKDWIKARDKKIARHTSYMKSVPTLQDYIKQLKDLQLETLSQDEYDVLILDALEDDLNGFHYTMQPLRFFFGTIEHVKMNLGIDRKMMKILLNTAEKHEAEMTGDMRRESFEDIQSFFDLDGQAGIFVIKDHLLVDSLQKDFVMAKYIKITIVDNYDPFINTFFLPTETLDEAEYREILSMDREQAWTDDKIVSFLQDLDWHGPYHEYDSKDRNFQPKYEGLLIRNLSKKINLEGGCPSITIYGGEPR